jgi:hypothetical protein
MQQCAPHSFESSRSKSQPLKKILSINCAGSMFQMDLIRMPEYKGYTQILTVIDHLSKYGYIVPPLQGRSAVECVNALLTSLSGSTVINLYLFWNC